MKADADRMYREALKSTSPDPVSQYRLANMMYENDRFSGDSCSCGEERNTMDGWYECD